LREEAYHKPSELAGLPMPPHTDFNTDFRGREPDRIRVVRPSQKGRTEMADWLRSMGDSSVSEPSFELKIRKPRIRQDWEKKRFITHTEAPENPLDS